MSDEFSRIARLAKRFSASSDRVVIGIGDDAAVLRASGKATVLTVDASVEGTHFRRAFASWEQIARRAIMAAASDLAAMGAQASAALVAMNLSRDIDEVAFDALIEGTKRAIDELSATLIGGNLASANEVSITTTWLGELDGSPLLRSGARPGDHVYVTGHVGAAALGLQSLTKQSRDERAEPFVERWRNPRARITEGLRIRELASACIDVSDGLVQDLNHICEASGVSAEIDVTQLPLFAKHHELADVLGVDGLAAALAGGEDYELLFTAPASVSAKELGTRIGRIGAGKGVSIAGAPASFRLHEQGYVHFRAP